MIECKLIVLVSIPVQIDKIRTTNCIPIIEDTKITTDNTQKVDINIFIRGKVSQNVFRYWFPTKYLQSVDSSDETTVRKLEVKSDETSFRLKSLNNKPSDFYSIALGSYNGVYYINSSMDLTCVIDPIHFDRIYDNEEEVIFLNTVQVLKQFNTQPPTVQMKYWSNLDTLSNTTVQYKDYNKYAVWLKEEAGVVMDPENNKVQIIFDKYELKSEYQEYLMGKYISEYYYDEAGHRYIYILNLDISLFDVDPIENPDSIEAILKKYLGFYFSNFVKSFVNGMSYIRYSYNKDGLVMEKIIDVITDWKTKFPRIIEEVITFGNLNDNIITPQDATTFISENEETFKFNDPYLMSTNGNKIYKQISVNQINDSNLSLVDIKLVIKGKIPEWLYKYLPLPIYLKYEGNKLVVSETETNRRIVSINAISEGMGINNLGQENQCSIDLRKVLGKEGE